MADDRPPRPPAGRVAKKAPAKRAVPAAPTKTAAAAAAAEAAGTQRGPGRPSNHQKLTDDLVAMFALAGTTVMMIDRFDGLVIIENAQALGEAVADIASRNPAIRAALDMMVKGSDYFGLVTVLSQIALPIMANHGLLPASFRAMAPTAHAEVPPAEPEPASPAAAPELADIASMFAPGNPAARAA